MKETKHLRLRSLAAFLVPLLFAVWMMQPTPLHRLLATEENPTAFFYQKDGVSPRSLAPEADSAPLLEGRWCVRAGIPETTGLDFLMLNYEGSSLFLLDNAQYLLLKDGRTFQIPGKTLLPQAMALLNDA